MVKIGEGVLIDDSGEYPIRPETVATRDALRQSDAALADLERETAALRDALQEERARAEAIRSRLARQSAELLEIKRRLDALMAGMKPLARAGATVALNVIEEVLGG